MKSSLMRPALALALVLGLSACGGKASFPIGVTVSGLQYQGLVLTTNNMDLPVTPPATPGQAVTASFPHAIEYGEEFEVKVKTPPQHQSCTYPPNDRSYFGTAGQLAQINAQISCFLNAYAIGGPVTGLKSDGLVLANGSTTAVVTKEMTKFQFPVTVQYGVTYGVTVLTQPAGQVCTVGPKGTGTMGDAEVTDIVITCT
jgi:hypothetical protein